MRLASIRPFRGSTTASASPCSTSSRAEIAPGPCRLTKLAPAAACAEAVSGRVGRDDSARPAARPTPGGSAPWPRTGRGTVVSSAAAGSLPASQNGMMADHLEQGERTEPEA
jgi:hypothetical protein